VVVACPAALKGPHRPTTHEGCRNARSPILGRAAGRTAPRRFFVHQRCQRESRLARRPAGPASRVSQTQKNKRDGPHWYVRVPRSPCLCCPLIGREPDKERVGPEDSQKKKTASTAGGVHPTNSGPRIFPSALTDRLHAPFLPAKDQDTAKALKAALP